jgi:hypothetical protein
MGCVGGWMEEAGDVRCEDDDVCGRCGWQGTDRGEKPTMDRREPNQAKFKTKKEAKSKRSSQKPKPKANFEF